MFWLYIYIFFLSGLLSNKMLLNFMRIFYMNSKDCEPHWWCDAALLINFIIYDYCKLCNIHFCIFFFFLHGTWKFRAFSLLPEYNFLLWQIKSTEKQQAGRSSIIFFKKKLFCFETTSIVPKIMSISYVSINNWLLVRS